MGDYQMMEGIGDTIYSSPVQNRYHYNEHPYMVMVSPENSPYASPARQTYMVNNSSMRSNIMYPSYQTQNAKNSAIFRYGRFSETPSHFKTTTGAYDELFTTNAASNAGLIHSDFIGLGGMDQTADNSLKYLTSEQYGFPESFNPRGAPNMPHKEKVSCWIDTIPTTCGDDNWFDECFPAFVSENFEEIDCSTSPSPDELFELQSRKITFLINKLYNLDHREKIITPEILERAKVLMNETIDMPNFDVHSSEQVLKKCDANEDVENKYTLENQKFSRAQSTPRKRKSRKH